MWFAQLYAQQPRPKPFELGCALERVFAQLHAVDALQLCMRAKLSWSDRTVMRALCKHPLLGRDAKLVRRTCATSEPQWNINTQRGCAERMA
jgi:hypothetical protein